MPPRSKETKKRKRPSMTLTEEQELEIKNAFDVYDPKQTGTISVKQARYALQSLGLNVDKEQLKSVADDNNDKKIHIDVFTQVLAGPKLVQRQKALRAFELFDKDGKGVICVEDLQRVALELGETSMTQLQLEEMVNDADMERQGFLSKEDFLAVAETLNL